jgi:GT2 family glycosyltransferase
VLTRGDRKESLRPADRAETADIRQRVQVDGKFLARAGQRFRIRGVTYGPFAPDADGHQFPPADRVVGDFAEMQVIGINAIRTYHLPPEWLLQLADQCGMGVFVDVPWPKHLCFLDSVQAQQHARRAVRQAAERGRDHSCLLAYSICNEIPSNIVRWHGAARVERFLDELMDVAKQADPGGLVTYASFPPTEYLDLSFLDFVTFNVYLHDPSAFRRYLFRLQNLVGDKPLLLGEIGMDTLRHGEYEQARFLAGHAREAVLAGLAGAFVFAWTDDWYTGGFPIEDWAFGITGRDRAPKASYHALGEVFAAAPAALLPARPRVSVVVCTYNGGRTLGECLRSLSALNYPDLEIIVVDDGSTDNTGEVLSQFRGVRAIRQTNQGLSHARNVGLHAATGAIVAYTDSDCYADPDWITHLVDQLQRTSAAAVGGPNLAPEDGWLAACVAASPGQPTHILETDQEAEHIPGCNMAFRREALMAIGGFDEQYRKAGDDVDICWRLQHAGRWITFAPAAFVWHHRRQSPLTYLKQQAGYGEAEARLRFKHPDRFNHWGGGKWRGVLYGPSLRGLCLEEPIVYRGIFASGMFQCLYRPGPAHWAMLPTSLEWHGAVAVIAIAAALFWSAAWGLMAAMLGLSLLIAILQATQVRLAPRHDSLQARWLIAALAYMQPLVRSWARYRTRLFAYRHPSADPEFHGGREYLPLSGRRVMTYWSEDGAERTRLLELVTAYLTERGWGKNVDSGWSDWDLEIYCHPWTVVRLATAQEEHGGGKRLIRVRCQMRLGGRTKLCGILTGLLAVVAVGLGSWAAGLAAGGVLAICAGAWRKGTRRAAQSVAVVSAMAEKLGLTRCDRVPATEGPGAEAQAEVLGAAQCS